MWCDTSVSASGLKQKSDARRTEGLFFAARPGGAACSRLLHAAEPSVSDCPVAKKPFFI